MSVTQKAAVVAYWQRKTISGFWPRQVAAHLDKAVADLEREQLLEAFDYPLLEKLVTLRWRHAELLAKVNGHDVDSVYLGNQIADIIIDHLQRKLASGTLTVIDEEDDYWYTRPVEDMRLIVDDGG
jgi:hypothetical protein